MFHTRCQVKQKQLDITTIQYTSPDLSLTDLRAKIAGAKRACEAKADTHVRRVSWFDLHWKAYEGLCLEDAHHATLSFFSAFRILEEEFLRRVSGILRCCERERPA